MTEILKEYPLVDEHGKRYRIFGRGCREYAPKIVTSGGEFLVGAVTYRKPELETIEQRKTCPFKGGMQPHCTEDCAFYADGCSLGTAQTGKRCPLPAHHTCGDNCMMYETGRCTLFAAERKPDK